MERSGIGKFDIKSMNEKVDGHTSIHSVNNFYIRKLSTHGAGMIPPARATIHCFFFLRKGNVSINVGERSITITENSCLIIPMGQIFSVTDYSQGIEGYMGGFHKDFLINQNSSIKHLTFLYGWLSRPISFGGKQLNYIENIFERIYDEWTSIDRDSLIIKTYLQALLQELGKQQKIVFGPQSGTAFQSITERFMQLLTESGYTKVDDYAREMNITAGHLSKCIKTVTGRSPFQWIEDKIMTEAKMLLYQTDLTIGEIATEVGISDVSYFSRAFKRNSGITPNQFRGAIKETSK